MTPLDKMLHLVRSSSQTAERLDRLFHALDIHDPLNGEKRQAVRDALAAERQAGREAFYNEALGLAWDDDHGNRVVAVDGLRLLLEQP